MKTTTICRSIYEKLNIEVWLDARDLVSRATGEPNFAGCVAERAAAGGPVPFT